MQRKSLIPTPLLSGEERASVVIAPLRNPGFFRLFHVIGFFIGIAWRWWATIFWPPLGRGRYRPRANARYVREGMEKLGGLWIKAGQLLAMRRDIMSDEFCDELSRLQDQAKGFPPSVARQIVEEDLGAPVEEFFDDFTDAPLAAASIGQVHEARLRESGGRVVIKVQRPDIKKSMHSDFRFIRFLVLLLKKFEVAPYAQWDRMRWELEKTLSDEVDYRLEASSISRMRKTLRRHKVYVPKVFARYCTPRVLVMEFVEGVSMSDYIKVAESDPSRLKAWQAENRVNPKRAGKRLYLSHIRQLFEDNLYHGDLHPGNILLLRKSRFALIDFGSVGSLEKSSLQKHRMLFDAVSDKNFTKAADLMILAAPPQQRSDLSEVKSDLIREFRSWESHTPVKKLSYHEKSLTTLFGNLARICGQHEISPSWSFLRLTRSDFTLDASLMFLMPKVNYLKLMNRYERQRQARALRRSVTRRAIFRRAIQLNQLLQPDPTWGENLYFEGEWLRQRAQMFAEDLSKASYVGKIVLSLLGRAALLFGVISVVVYFHKYSPGAMKEYEGNWLRQVLDSFPNWEPGRYIVAALLAIYFFRIIKLIKRRVERKEVRHPAAYGH